MRWGIGSLVLIALLVPRALRAQVPQPAQTDDVIPEAPASVEEPRAEDAELLGHAHPHTPRLWLRGEYLLWYIKNHDFPALVTTGLGTDRPGALGRPGTGVLYGGADVDAEVRHGARFSAGIWLDDEEHLGVEAGYFFLSSRAARFAVASTPTLPIIARPFFDVVNNRQDSSLIAFPGLAMGRVEVSAVTFVDGLDLNALCTLWHGEHWHITALAGFRYLNLEEDVLIAERVQVSPTSPRFGGSTIAVTDVFDTQNGFYGGQLGAKFAWRRKRWVMDFIAKVALGDSHQVVRTGGFTAIDGTLVANAGLLALASNRGRATRDAFAVVPEVGVNIGYQVAESLRLFVGYSFLYLSDVARPGEQIDVGLNPNLIPTSATFGAPGGPARPALSVGSTDFWAQGVSFGVEWRY